MNDGLLVEQSKGERESMQIKKKETMGNAGWQSRGKESKGMDGK